MSDETTDSGERPIDSPPSPPVRERFDPSRPCGELLADVPWDGVRADAKSMSARVFLGTLLG